MAETPPWETESPPWASDAFNAAIGGILASEGGYVNDPVDRGGETKFGISKRSYPNVDIASLTKEDALNIYRKDYWDAIGGDSLPEDMQAVALDAAINQGVGFATEALKKAKTVGEFVGLRRERYANIIANDPSQKRFEKGWENRVQQFAAPWEY